MGSIYRLLPTLLGSAGLASAAMATVPLQTTATTTPAAQSTGMLTASATGASATSTVGGSVSGGSVNVAKFDTANGILVGATVGVNTAVSATAQVTGTVKPSGNGRTVTSTTTLTGSVSAAGVSFSTPSALTATRSCSGGNCANSPGNQTNVTAGTITGSSAVPLASLSSYAGVGTVAFALAASGSTTVTNGSGALTGTANGLFTFGSATAASNVYSITYDYLNFADPSFSNTSNVNALTLDFGTLFQNSGPVTLNFTLTNIGNANSAGLSLTSVGRSTNDANFTTTLTPFVNGLDGGNSATYSVTFNPVTLGSALDDFILTLQDYAPGGIGGRTYQLTAHTAADVIAEPAVAPEPAAWAMMLIGFGLVGATRRRGNAARQVAA